MTSEVTSESSRPEASGTSTRSFIREVAFLLIVAIGVAALVRAFVFQVFFIPSGSMEDTLQVGDRVLVSKVTYHLRDIERGDIVVFDGTDSFSPETVVEPASNPIVGAIRSAASFIGMAPSSERDFVKRVIGVGGDRVVCCNAAGRVTVNGVALDESSYLFPGDVPSEDAFDIAVPENSLFVMGDHRSQSSDSRAHLGDPGGGFVPVDRVIGRAFVVAFPIARAQVLGIPDTFSQPGLASAGSLTPTGTPSASAVPTNTGSR